MIKQIMLEEITEDIVNFKDSITVTISQHIPNIDMNNFRIVKKGTWANLTSLTNPCAKILEARAIDRIQSKYIEEDILRGNRNGRIHGQFLQLASDEGGTRTGRLAAKTPNLQQVPSRSALGKQVRACFIPEDGCQWAKFDYNSQE